MSVNKKTHAETIADIIAEMRRNFADGNPYYAAGLPDRLDAAHKRERGDCAKLREFARLVSHMNDDGYWNGSASICALVDKAKNALAAPARNCDVYATHNDAMQAFEVFVREQGKLGFINPFTEAFKWLLAPATEKEGGAK